MSTRVFISYGRTDSRHIAGRLRDRLADAFGDENVFFDVDSVEFGVDFREVIRSTLATVDVVVAVIGTNFDAVRLARANDYVRLELAEAMAQGKLVIPVLVDDARMPAAEELPIELESLSYLNAAPLRPDPDFRRDATRLIESLVRALGPRATLSKRAPLLRAQVESGSTWDDPSDERLYELLRDIERGREQFLVVDRTVDPSGQTYAQAIRSDGQWLLERRDGSADQHYSATFDDLSAIHAALKAWAFELPGWQNAAPWERTSPDG